MSAAADRKRAMLKGMADAGNSSDATDNWRSYERKVGKEGARAGRTATVDIESLLPPRTLSLTPEVKDRMIAAKRRYLQHVHDAINETEAHSARCNYECEIGDIMTDHLAGKHAVTPARDTAEAVPRPAAVSVIPEPAAIPAPIVDPAPMASGRIVEIIKAVDDTSGLDRAPALPAPAPVPIAPPAAANNADDPYQRYSDRISSAWKEPPPTPPHMKRKKKGLHHVDA